MKLIKKHTIIKAEKIKEQKNTIKQENRNEQLKNEYTQERIEFIKLLLKTYTPTEISQNINMPVNEIKTIQINMN